MKTWDLTPFVFKRKFLLTLLAGLAAAVISLVIFLLTDDRIILILGGALLLCCVFRSRAIWKLIYSKTYETVDGVCTGITSLPFRRYRKVYLLDESGIELILLLDRSIRFCIGMPYRFYFQKNIHSYMGIAYLDASLFTSSFLGYEELPYWDGSQPKSR